jgi:uncharacterized protein (DUF302 family)
MTTSSIPGFISKPSPYAVSETIQRLCALLKSKGIAIFALIDHSGEAEKAGLKMRPTQLLIFGNPKGGTPLMLAAPSTAIDLPLKALVWEDTDGKVWLSYNSPDYLQQRHGFPAGLETNIAALEPLLVQALAN